jgi:hypothetical protein
MQTTTFCGFSVVKSSQISKKFTSVLIGVDKMTSNTFFCVQQALFLQQ